MGNMAIWGEFTNFVAEIISINYFQRDMITQELLKETFERKLALRRYL